MKMILLVLFLLDLLLDVKGSKGAKHLKKKDEELLPIAWHLKSLRLVYEKDETKK